MSYVARDERMGPWRPIPAPRRAIWRYHLASTVAVFRDSLEVAGVYPFRRYFWAPFLQTPEEIAEWAQFEAWRRVTDAKIKALGPNPSLLDVFKAGYTGNIVDALTADGAVK